MIRHQPQHDALLVSCIISPLSFIFLTDLVVCRGILTSNCYVLADAYWSLWKILTVSVAGFLFFKLVLGLLLLRRWLREDDEREIDLGKGMQSLSIANSLRLVPLSTHISMQ